MPKNKKSRKQKILADKRHHQEYPQTDGPTSSLLSVQKEGKSEISFATTRPIKNISKQELLTHDYKYISKDLWKTALLSVSIVIVELFIKRFTS
jgi:hypothetical protein